MELQYGSGQITSKKMVAKYLHSNGILAINILKPMFPVYSVINCSSITTVADERDVTVSIQNMGSNPTSGKTSYYITAEVGTVRPEYAHTIRVYVGPEHLLRARPMFQLNQADFYHMDFKRLLNPQAQGMIYYPRVY